MVTVVDLVNDLEKQRCYAEPTLVKIAHELEQDRRQTPFVSDQDAQLVVAALVDVLEQESPQRTSKDAAKHALYCLLVWGLPHKALHAAPGADLPPRLRADGPAAALLRCVGAHTALSNAWQSLSVTQLAIKALQLLLQQLAASEGHLSGPAEAQLTRLAPRLWRLAVALPPPPQPNAKSVTIVYVEIQERLRACLALCQQLLPSAALAELSRRLAADLRMPSKEATPPPAEDPPPLPLAAQLAVLVGSYSADACPALSPAATPLRARQLTTPAKSAEGTPASRKATPTPSPGAAADARSSVAAAEALNLTVSGIRTLGVFVRLLGKAVLDKSVGQALLDMLTKCFSRHAPEAVPTEAFAAWQAFTTVCALTSALVSKRQLLLQPIRFVLQKDPRQAPREAALGAWVHLVEAMAAPQQAGAVTAAASQPAARAAGGRDAACGAGGHSPGGGGCAAPPPQPPPLLDAVGFAKVVEPVVRDVMGREREAALSQKQRQQHPDGGSSSCPARVAPSLPALQHVVRALELCADCGPALVAATCNLLTQSLCASPGAPPPTRARTPPAAPTAAGVAASPGGPPGIVAAGMLAAVPALMQLLGRCCQLLGDARAAADALEQRHEPSLEAVGSSIDPAALLVPPDDAAGDGPVARALQLLWLPAFDAMVGVVAAGQAAALPNGSAALLLSLQAACQALQAAAHIPGAIGPLAAAAKTLLTCVPHQLLTAQPVAPQLPGACLDGGASTPGNPRRAGRASPVVPTITSGASNADDAVPPQPPAPAAIQLARLTLLLLIQSPSSQEGCLVSLVQRALQLGQQDVEQQLVRVQDVLRPVLAPATASVAGTTAAAPCAAAAAATVRVTAVPLSLRRRALAWVAAARAVVSCLPSQLAMLDSAPQQAAAVQQLVTVLLQPLLDMLGQATNDPADEAAAAAQQLLAAAPLWAQAVEAAGAAVRRWRRPLEHAALLRLGRGVGAALKRVDDVGALHGDVRAALVRCAVAVAAILQPLYADLALGKPQARGGSAKSAYGANHIATSRVFAALGAGSTGATAPSAPASALQPGAATPLGGAKLQWGQVNTTWMAAASVLKDLFKSLLAAHWRASGKARGGGAAVGMAAAAAAAGDVQLGQVSATMAALFLATAHAEVAARMLDEWEGTLSMALTLCRRQADNPAAGGAAVDEAPSGVLVGLWLALLQHMCALAPTARLRTLQGCLDSLGPLLPMALGCSHTQLGPGTYQALNSFLAAAERPGASLAVPLPVQEAIADLAPCGDITGSLPMLDWRLPAFGQGPSTTGTAARSEAAPPRVAGPTSTPPSAPSFLRTMAESVRCGGARTHAAAGVSGAGGAQVSSLQPSEQVVRRKRALEDAGEAQAAGEADERPPPALGAGVAAPSGKRRRAIGVTTYTRLDGSESQAGGEGSLTPAGMACADPRGAGALGAATAQAAGRAAGCGSPRRAVAPGGEDTPRTAVDEGEACTGGDPHAVAGVEAGAPVPAGLSVPDHGSGPSGAAAPTAVQAGGRPLPTTACPRVEHRAQAAPPAQAQAPTAGVPPMHGSPAGPAAASAPGVPGSAAAPEPMDSDATHGSDSEAVQPAADAAEGARGAKAVPGVEVVSATDVEMVSAAEVQTMPAADALQPGAIGASIGTLPATPGAPTQILSGSAAAHAQAPPRLSWAPTAIATPLPPRSQAPQPVVSPRAAPQRSAAADAASSPQPQRQPSAAATTTVAADDAGGARPGGVQPQGHHAIADCGTHPQPREEAMRLVGAAAAAVAAAVQDDASALDILPTQDVLEGVHNPAVRRAFAMPRHVPPPAARTALSTGDAELATSSGREGVAPDAAASAPGGGAPGARAAHLMGTGGRTDTELAALSSMVEAFQAAVLAVQARQAGQLAALPEQLCAAGAGDGPALRRLLQWQAALEDHAGDLAHLQGAMARLQRAVGEVVRSRVAQMK